MESRDRIEALLREFLRLVMHRSMNGPLRVLRSRGLSMPHLAALFRIHMHPGVGIGDIGDHLDVTTAAASQLLDRLVKLGLVDRREAAEDRRGKALSLTAAGMDLVREGLEARTEWIADLVARIDADRATAVAEALGSLVDAARELPADPCTEGRTP